MQITITQIKSVKDSVESVYIKNVTGRSPMFSSDYIFTRDVELAKRFYRNLDHQPLIIKSDFESNSGIITLFAEDMQFKIKKMSDGNLALLAIPAVAQMPLPDFVLSPSSRD